MKPTRSARRRSGFTLIELMIVIGIVAIVMGLGLPSLVRTFRKEALRQAVSDIVEVASHARASAIQSGGVVEMTINPEGRTVSVAGGGGGGEEKPGVRNQNKTSTTWGENLMLELLDVNFIEYKDAPQARVRFFPNGTCDEARLILRNDAGEYRMIAWEVTTGLAMWEADPQRFMR